MINVGMKGKNNFSENVRGRDCEAWGWGRGFGE